MKHHLYQYFNYKYVIRVAIFATLPSKATECAPIEYGLDASIIMLGEQHGKRNQPVFAACLLKQLAAAKQPMALAMEHIQQEHQLLTQDWVQNYDNADQFAIALQWWRQGWPSWMIYRPLFAAAYDRNIPLIATDKLNTLPEDEIMEIWGNDYEHAYDAWQRIINDYHQGGLEAQKLHELIILQMSRDIHMSRAIATYMQNHPKAKIIFYAGQDHIRNDFSIKQLLQQYQVITIAQNCPKLGHQFDYNTQLCTEEN